MNAEFNELFYEDIILMLKHIADYGQMVFNSVRKGRRVDFPNTLQSCMGDNG